MTDKMVTTAGETVAGKTTADAPDGATLAYGMLSTLDLQAFHAAIFGDIYPWAGELRTVDIAKRTPFCPARNLVSYAGQRRAPSATSRRVYC